MPANKGDIKAAVLVIDEHAGDPLSLSRPYIPFPSSHADKAQIVEIDIAVMTGTDVPEEGRLAEAVVWGLRKGAGTRDGATAICRTNHP
jgi:hypothetical protein